MIPENHFYFQYVMVVSYYASNFEEVEGACLFMLFKQSRTVRDRILKIWYME